MGTAYNPEPQFDRKMSGQRPVGTLFRYGTTVFLSSALLLVLEIVAGRLLAPYVGVSLYTWTSIIGVILAGLYIRELAGRTDGRSGC